MANVLVVYATREGQTRKVAERIGTTLRLSGHKVDVLDVERAPARVDVQQYHAVFVGSPVRAQRYLRPVERFVRAHLPELQRVPSLFFSVNLAVLSRTSDGRGQTMKIVDEFLTKTGWRPVRVELVAGALPYTKYSFLVRFVMRRIARKEGGDTDTSMDHEYTDWNAVDRFAREFVLEVTAPVVAPRARPRVVASR
ncbi:MAG TPA: menaquinone-dependent protoporphyrinogen IX dehydrogenase [Myxococcaceae bacterium]|nr:menaquinone-dependent protoporphyrinogen IX dehydrogenase [Myxococcaceae bacterium]